MERKPARWAENKNWQENYLFFMLLTIFPSIGGCDALLKGAHRYGPIGGKWQGFTLKNKQKKCYFGTLSYFRREVPARRICAGAVCRKKIRKINDANFLLDIGLKSFYSGSKASDVCPEA